MLIGHHYHILSLDMMKYASTYMLPEPLPSTRWTSHECTNASRKIMLMRHSFSNCVTLNWDEVLTQYVVQPLEPETKSLDMIYLPMMKTL